MRLKDTYQEKAEEIAQERYECGFYDLEAATREEVYKEAMNSVVQSFYSTADYLRKKAREER